MQITAGGSNGKSVKVNAKQKVEELLRKRDEKLQKKENAAKEIKLGGKRFATEEDKEIVR